MSQRDHPGGAHQEIEAHGEDGQDRHLRQKLHAEVVGPEPRGDRDARQHRRHRKLQWVAPAHPCPLRTGIRPAGLMSRMRAIRA